MNMKILFLLNGILLTMVTGLNAQPFEIQLTTPTRLMARLPIETGDIFGTARPTSNDISWQTFVSIAKPALLASFDENNNPTDYRTDADWHAQRAPYERPIKYFICKGKNGFEFRHGENDSVSQEEWDNALSHCKIDWTKNSDGYAGGHTGSYTFLVIYEPAKKLKK